MESVRAFIAIELPAEVKTELASLQDKLKAGSACNAKWVAPQGLHLTLKFLGNVRQDLLTDITNAMTKTAAKIPHIKLKIGRLGVFPSPRHVQIVWTALEGDVEVLASLQKDLERELEPLGFKAEKRSFKAHLTLARVREAATDKERGTLARSIMESSFKEGASFTASSISLMSSRLTPQGAVYTKIGKAGLST